MFVCFHLKASELDDVNLLKGGNQLLHGLNQLNLEGELEGEPQVKPWRES